MNLRYCERLFVDEGKDELAHEPALQEHGLDTTQVRLLMPGWIHPQRVRLPGEGASRAGWAQLKRFLRTGAGSPAKAVLASTFEPRN